MHIYDTRCIFLLIMHHYYNLITNNNLCTSRGTSIVKRKEDFERRKTMIATGGIKNLFVMVLHQQGTSVSGDHSAFLIMIPKCN